MRMARSAELVRWEPCVCCCNARSAGLGLVVVAACLHLHLHPSVHRSYPPLIHPPTIHHSTAPTYQTPKTPRLPFYDETNR